MCSFRFPPFICRGDWRIDQEVTSYPNLTLILQNVTSNTAENKLYLSFLLFKILSLFKIKHLFKILYWQYRKNQRSKMGMKHTIKQRGKKEKEDGKQINSKV